MNEPKFLPRLKGQIENLYKCNAVYIEKVWVTVIGKPGTNTSWYGRVEVFRLENHPEAELCYACKRKGKGEKFSIFLGVPPIFSPSAAVHAAIAAEGKRTDFTTEEFSLEDKEPELKLAQGVLTYLP